MLQKPKSVWFLPSPAQFSAWFAACSIRSVLISSKKIIPVAKAPTHRLPRTPTKILRTLTKILRIPLCKHLAEFLGEKQSEIGDKISLYTFEVWKDKNNLAFLKSFGKFLGENPKGVPYIIIGNKTYSGFSETDEETKQEIIDLIKTEANKTDKIDKYQEYKKSK